MKIITEDTPVAYDDTGHDILAGSLQRWAYNQLSIAPDMYEFIKELYSAILNNYEKIGASRYVKLEQILTKAEGKA